MKEVAAVDVVKGTADVFSKGQGGFSPETVTLDKCFAMNPKHNSDLCGLHNIHEAGKRQPEWSACQLSARILQINFSGPWCILRIFTLR